MCSPRVHHWECRIHCSSKLFIPAAVVGMHRVRCMRGACMHGGQSHDIGIHGCGGMIAKCQRALMPHGGGTAGAHACTAHSIVSCRPATTAAPPPRISSADKRAARPIHFHCPLMGLERRRGGGGGVSGQGPCKWGKEESRGSSSSSGQWTPWACTCAR